VRLSIINEILLQGFKFLGKAMKITYARGTSDIVARANGSIILFLGLLMF
jgi:hypothetical protein